MKTIPQFQMKTPAAVTKMRRWFATGTSQIHLRHKSVHVLFLTLVSCCVVLEHARAALSVATNTGIVVQPGGTVVLTPARLQAISSVALPNQIVFSVTGNASNGVLKAGGADIRWTLNPANNHSYRLTLPLDWFSASAAASAQGAYLAAINDAAENAWILNQFGPANTAWLGLRGNGRNGGWGWVNGEPFSYQNWNTRTGEPNGDPGGETSGQIYLTGGDAGKWNDLNPGSALPGLMEFNGIKLGTFTQQDIDSGRVTFTDGGGANSDRLVVSISDGASTLSNIVVSISVQTTVDPVASKIFRPGSITNSLVGWWKLDEISGNRLDSSGNGNHLTPTGGVSSVTDDYWGTGEPSADFEFTSSQRQHLFITDSAQRGLNLSNFFTISAWIKLESNNDVPIVSKYGPGSGQGYEFNYRGGNSCLQLTHGASTTEFPGQIQLNKWTHIAVVYDGQKGLVAFFIDGNVRHIQSIRLESPPSPRPFMLGWFLNAGTSFDGLMKDVAVWTTNLTSLQIKSLALGADFSTRAFRPDRIPNGLVSYWKLNEISSGSTSVSRVDSGPGGNHLTDLSIVPGDAGGFIEGAAARFVGEPHGTMGDYLKRANSQLSSTLKLDSSTQSLSIAVWAYSTGTEAQDVICALSLQNANYRGFILGFIGQREVANFRVNRGSVSSGELSASARRNTWSHLVGVYDADAGQARLYVDGILRTNAPYTGGVGPADGDLLIGTQGETSAADFYTGRLCDLAIWSRALTSNEIVLLATGLPVQSAGVVSYWKLDEAAGATRLDSLGVNHLVDFNGVGAGAGKVGGAASFRRTASQYLFNATESQTTLNFANQTYSVLAWINPESSGTSQAVAAKWQPATGYMFRVEATAPASMNLTHDNGGDYGTRPVVAGTWQQVGVSWFANVQKARFWHNGALDREIGTAAPSPTTHQFRLGASASGGHLFDGRMDEVIIARRDFREEEIKALYNRGLNGKEVFPTNEPIGNLEITPATLDFGRVFIGASSNSSFQVVNRSGTNASVTAATSLPFVLKSAGPLNLAPGATGLVTIVFSPIEFGPVVRDVTLSNAQDGLSFTRSVQGQGAIINDLDNDGLLDNQELYLWGTDPTKNDTDSDGIPDGWEIAHGMNPRVNDAGDDFDQDGVSNLEEYRRGLNPESPFTQGRSDYERVFGVRTNRFTYDRNDRLTGAEYWNGLVIAYRYDGNGNPVRQYYGDNRTYTNALPLPWRLQNQLSISDFTGTNAAFADSDGDGWSNYQEWRAGTSAIDPNSNPGVLAASGIVISNVPQTAPFVRILPVPSAGVRPNVPVAIRIWDAEGNPSLPSLQFQVVGTTNWSNAILTRVDGIGYSTNLRVAALPGGSEHTLTWNAATQLAATVTNVLLRAQAADLSLVGNWSDAVPYRVDPFIDSDGDGIPDSWEIATGTNPQRVDSNIDADGDGMTNLDEFRAGTNPNDANSSLRLRIVRTNALVRITWQGGTNAAQVLERSFTIPWPSNNFSAVWTNAASEGGVFVEAILSTNTYYRLRIVP